MPLRIRAYTALAEEKYKLPVYPVLINILPNSKSEKISNFYQSEFMGIKARVLTLWKILEILSSIFYVNFILSTIQCHFSHGKVFLRILSDPEMNFRANRRCSIN
jgi:hypothetical protein